MGVISRRLRQDIASGVEDVVMRDRSLMGGLIGALALKSLGDHQDGKFLKVLDFGSCRGGVLLVKL